MAKKASRKKARKKTAKRRIHKAKSVPKPKREPQPRDKYGRFIPRDPAARKARPKPVRDKLGRYKRTTPPPRPRRPKGAPQPRDPVTKKFITYASAVAKGLAEVPEGFEIIPDKAPERGPPLSEVRKDLQARLEAAGQRASAWGLEAYEVMTHIQRDPGWVEAELQIRVPPEYDAQDVMVRLQEDWFEPSGRAADRYSFMILRDPTSAPDMTAEQRQRYLSKGDHRFQTYFGYDLADVTATAIGVVDNTTEFGYGDKPHTISFRVIYTPTPQIVERKPRGRLS